MINILTLKVGKKYSYHYVNNLFMSLKKNSKEPFNFYCYTDDSKNLFKEINVINLSPNNIVKKQFYKIDFHNMPFIKGKCLILDIDYIIVNNVDEILSWNLDKKCFGCNERWWSELQHFCKINGGFQMFYQGDTKHIYDIFYENPEHWQKYYVETNQAQGPLNGEQNFIDNHLKLERSWLPKYWFAKYDKKILKHLLKKWYDKIDKDFYFFDGEFDSRIKMVHFSSSENMIEDYKEEWIRKYWKM